MPLLKLSKHFTNTRKRTWIGVQGKIPDPIGDYSWYHLDVMTPCSRCDKPTMMFIQGVPVCADCDKKHEQSIREAALKAERDYKPEIARAAKG